LIRWRLWLSMMLAACLALLYASAAQAQRPGSYQILQATYGTAWNGVDVTAHVQQLALQGRSFTASNDTFGTDPAPGQRKVLRIEAREANGRNRVLEFAESQWVDANMFAAGGWSPQRPGQGAGHWPGNSQVLQATYGTRWQSMDVTARVSQAIDQGRGGFTVSNDFFGQDPAPGHRKMLTITMRDRSGRMHNFDFGESAWVEASQLIATGSAGQPGEGRWQDDQRNVPLNIHRATYGEGPRQVDVTQQLRDRVHNGRLRLRVSNDLVGYDPFPNVRKRLVVEYSVGSGRQTRQTAVDESQSLSLR